MNQLQLARLLASHRGDAAMVLSPGTFSNDLHAIAPRQPTLYHMELGYAAPICVGIALGAPGRRVVAVEGDGSMLAGLAVLPDIGRYQPANLTVLVVDNEHYHAVADGRYPAFATATGSGTDLEAIARGSGIERAVTVRTEREADEVLGKSVREPGPWFIVAKTLDRSPLPVPGPGPSQRWDGPGLPDVWQNAHDFAAAMSRWHRRDRTTAECAQDRS